MNLVKVLISYFSTFFAGMYFLRLCDGERDFFMVLGFTVCLVLTVVTTISEKAKAKAKK